MARPKKVTHRTKTLSDGSVASYARFTDQHGVRHEVLLGYDLAPEKLDAELEAIRVDVRRGVWKRPVKVERDRDPTFHVFASEWWADRSRDGMSERTREWYETWALGTHLLPYLHDRRLTDFDVHLIKALKQHLHDKRWPTKRYSGKGWQGRGECPPGQVPGSNRLGVSSVNDLMTVLGIVLQAAVEDPGIALAKNPARTKVARTKDDTRRGDGSWLDYDQLMALLDAADEIDRTTSRGDYRNLGRRALLATLFLGGLRISECLQLERRDINWTRGDIHVRKSKTPAGTDRHVPMHRMLFDLMSDWWLRHPDPRSDALLFPSATGKARERNNSRNRVLAPAVRLGETLLVERGQNPFPQRLNRRGEVVPDVQHHSGRRTAITWWAEAAVKHGYDEKQLMVWVGHEDPGLTLRLYRKARSRPKDRRVIAAMAPVPDADKGEPANAWS